jgi:hypothetical protein
MDIVGPEMDPVVEAYKKDVDLSLIRKNLKLSVEQRFVQAMELARFADELRRAGKHVRAKSTDGE